jgi:predicted nucleic-acid-binding protein
MLESTLTVKGPDDRTSAHSRCAPYRCRYEIALVPYAQRHGCGSCENQIDSESGGLTESARREREESTRRHQRHEPLALMPAVDTNILVRYLVRDNARQHAAVVSLLREAVEAEENLYVPVTVTLELEWVLRSTYKARKEQIVHTLSALLATIELRFEAEEATEIALALYQESNADFADCLHVALGYVAGETPLWTLDRVASRLEGAKLLR